MTQTENATRALSVMLTPSAYEKLMTKATEQGHTVSGLARWIITRYVETSE